MTYYYSFVMKPIDWSNKCSNPYKSCHDRVCIIQSIHLVFTYGIEWTKMTVVTCVKQQ